MNLKDAQVQELLLLAGRAPDRLLPDQHLVEGLALRLLDKPRTEWPAAAIQARVCPACLWPLERCADCDPDPTLPVELSEPYCAHCDIHWGADGERAPEGAR